MPPSGLDLRPAGRFCLLAFRTHPAPDRSTPLDFDGAATTLTPVAAVGRDGELELETPRRPSGRLVEVPLTVRVDGRQERP